MPSEKIYNKLSIIYNILMSKVRYDDWSDYLCEVVKPYVTKNAKVLELAGGNCSLALHFVKYFPNIIVSDRSHDMLVFGTKSLPKVCCDMVGLPFKSKFDLIFSTFDSINYLTNKKNLLKLFREVKTILNDEGIFTFDVSLEKNSLIHSERPIRKGNYKGISFIHKSTYNKNIRIHKNIFQIKINRDIFTEVHRQKIYPFDLYFDLISKAGLYVAECLKAFSFKKADNNSERVQFIVKKSR